MNTSSEHINDLIAKVLAGEAGREEIDLLEGWMNEALENRNYFDETRNIFAQIDSFKVEHKVDTVKAWEKLSKRISSEQVMEPETKVISLFRRPGLRIAASLILIATLALLANYFLNNNSPVPLTLATRQKVTEQKLPDGSKVTLNKNSEIAYVENAKKNIREVKLKGEAFFEVVHDTELPFEITIGEVSIKDIGTSFNVKALPESNTIEVLVESGEVYFYTSTNKGVNLVKGEKAIYNKSTKEFVKSIPSAVENTISYKSKSFQFKESPLREVIRQLNAVYGSTIVLSDERMGNCRLTTMFNDLTIDSIVEIIAETHNFEIEYSDGMILLKGQPCVE